MFEFQWWYCFILLPLPLLIWKLSKPQQEQKVIALHVPFIDDFSQSTTDIKILRKSRLKLLFPILAWLGLIAAAARPVWVGEPIELAVSGRDLMIAVDLSGSMEQQDFRVNNRVVNRLQATKYVAGNFIDKRVGDRVGLILFGDKAYLQAPLTFDRKTVVTLLNESAINLAGQRTAIGDAIGLALKRLHKKEDKEHVLILMTDGANTAGIVSPHEAAEKAAEAGLKIYTVGIGSESQQIRTQFGFQFNMQSSDLDERTLKAIAETTGGQYFRARDIQEFEKIYAELDKLEPIERSVESWRPQKELYIWPLGFALILSLLIALLRITRRNA